MHSISSHNEFKEYTHKPAAVIKFTASWCGPCQAIAPAVDTLAAQHPGIACAEVDIDKNQSLAQSYGVSAVPTFLFFSSGKIVQTVKGADLNGVTGGFKALSSKTSAASLKSQAVGKGYKVNSSRSGRAPVRFSLQQLKLYIILFVVSLFSLDARQTAKATLQKQGILPKY